MEYRDMLQLLAPCGLDCGRCADFDRGEIAELSGRLLGLLGEYGRVAGMKAEAKPEFAAYGAFRAVLESFSRGACGGCRSARNICPIASCRAKDCIKERSVEFCFQCPDYPCEGQFAGSALRKRWMALNDRMKEVGVEAFYRERLQSPRYPGKID